MQSSFFYFRASCVRHVYVYFFLYLFLAFDFGIRANITLQFYSCLQAHLGNILLKHAPWRLLRVFFCILVAIVTGCRGSSSQRRVDNSAAVCKTQNWRMWWVRSGWWNLWSSWKLKAWGRRAPRIREPPARNIDPKREFNRHAEVSEQLYTLKL